MNKRMRGDKPRWITWLCRSIALAAAALILGFVYGGWNLRQNTPSLPQWTVQRMAAEGDALWATMFPKNGSGGSLVRMDAHGTLLNELPLSAGQTCEALDSGGGLVYAIQNTVMQGTMRQSLLCFSVKHQRIRSKTLLKLDAERDGVPIFWSGIAAPEDGETGISVTGIDANYQGWLLRWDTDTGSQAVEKVLEGERLYALQPADGARLLWIDQEGRAGQIRNGAQQRDILNGIAETPYAIARCDTHCFLLDSVQGNIYEVDTAGNVSVFRKGSQAVGASGYSYRTIECFTAYQEADGAVRGIGVFPVSNGTGNVIAGDVYAIDHLTVPNTLCLRILWSGSWRCALVAALAMALLTGLVMLMFCSRRLVVRLSACEVVTAFTLTGVLSAVQFVSFRQALREQAAQSIKTVGESIAWSLSENDWTEAELRDAALAQMEMISNGEVKETFTVSIFLNTSKGLTVGYDSNIPAGCLVQDVKSQDYLDYVDTSIHSQGKPTNVGYVDHMLSLYITPFTQTKYQGYVAISSVQEANALDYGAFFRRLLPVLAVCPAAFLALILMTRRLLRPLDEIRAGLEMFYATKEGGNTIDLTHMPKTELYEIVRVFNGLSVQTKAQFNDLATINAAYVRLVPACLLQMLGEKTVQGLYAGEHAAVDGATLVLLPKSPEPSIHGVQAQDVQAQLEPAARHIHAHKGFLIDHEKLGNALCAVFSEVEQARKCAWNWLDEMEDTPHILAAVFSGKVEVGVFGTDTLLYPMSIAAHFDRHLAVLKRLNTFGAVLVYGGGTPSPSFRLLGWDDGIAYYEDTSFRESIWQTQWHEAAGFWAEAMTLFQMQEFQKAMRQFAQVTRILPNTDAAARWYLFRCDALRDTKQADTQLLFDWREEYDKIPAS